MSDLKHQTLEQLYTSKHNCITYITNLKSTLAGQQTRLEWINKYIYEQTPKELTIQEIERLLGHKVILK